MKELETAQAQSAALSDDLAALEDDLRSAGAALTRELARAILQGKELDGILQRLVLKQADKALTSALEPVYGLIGDLGSSLVGAVVGPLLGGVGQAFSGAGAGAAQSVFNVNVSTPDAASFRASETQVASSLSRAVTRGTRGL